MYHSPEEAVEGFQNSKLGIFLEDVKETRFTTAIIKNLIRQVWSDAQSAKVEEIKKMIGQGLQTNLENPFELGDLEDVVEAGQAIGENDARINIISQLK